MADVEVDNADKDNLNEILTTRASCRCPANCEGESLSTCDTGSSASTGTSPVSNLDLHNAEDNLSVLSSINDCATSPPCNSQINADVNAKDGQVASLPIIATTKAGGKGEKAVRVRVRGTSKKFKIPVLLLLLHHSPLDCLLHRSACCITHVLFLHCLSSDSLLSSVHIHYGMFSSIKYNDFGTME